MRIERGDRRILMLKDDIIIMLPIYLHIKSEDVHIKENDEISINFCNVKVNALGDIVLMRPLSELPEDWRKSIEDEVRHLILFAIGEERLLRHK